MDSVRVKGYINQDGTIEANLPENFIAGEIELEIPVKTTKSSRYTLGDVLDSGLVGIGADTIPENMDSQMWVEQQREKRQQNYG